MFPDWVFPIKPSRLLPGLAAFSLLGLFPTASVGQEPPSGTKRQGNAGTKSAFVAAPDNATAWKHLPAAEKGAATSLPVWARALAPSLPHTAAAMLELDYLHREKSPLDAKLRAWVRLAVARANGCAFAEAEAAADLRRAGLDDAGLAALAGKPESWPVDADLLAFARKLTLESQTVTDDEVARLMKRYGEGQMVALVQHIAYANFQDRLLFGLGLARDTETSLPAAEVRFIRPPLGASLARLRRKPSPMNDAFPPDPAFLKPDREWLALDLETLKKGIERQKSRRPRIALTDEHDSVVHWGQVCRQHQPEHANAWCYCMWSFGAEGLQDPVMEASVLWVVTRTQRSFY